MQSLDHPLIDVPLGDECYQKVPVLRTASDESTRTALSSESDRSVTFRDRGSAGRLNREPSATMRTSRTSSAKPSKPSGQPGGNFTFAAFRLCVLPLLIWLQFSVNVAVRTSGYLTFRSVGPSIGIFMMAAIVFRHAIRDYGLTAQLLLVPEVILDAVLVTVSVGYPGTGHLVLAVSAVVLAASAVLVMALQRIIQIQTNKSVDTECC